ncbi:hypothetical protein GCM10010124_21140 [Pilimelia terevasa]|uniref:SCP domain-containing protein n=1 Tax=Pilimelia terevasa TaxID=53372 RepID=A0A8J3FJA0_9ACTN|nr:CAP domain-containing protein [Pilimelia terevasa]GGK28259.1 hypothetical protein GCM10010124_21140 [Pilimelia terevasa]
MTRPFPADPHTALRRLARPLLAASALLAVASGTGACAVDNGTARGVPAADAAADVAADPPPGGEPPTATPAAPPADARPTAAPSPTAGRQNPPPRRRPDAPARPPAPRKPAPPKPAPADRGASTAQEREVTRLINIQRRRHGCGAVTIDAKLLRAARGHSADMAARQYFSHTGKDGRQPWDRAAAAGFRSRSVSENIAMGTGVDAARVVRMWMDSPGHRANILRCGSGVTAVGRAARGGTAYWTQMFGGR